MAVDTRAEQYWARRHDLHWQRVPCEWEKSVYNPSRKCSTIAVKEVPLPARRREGEEHKEVELVETVGGDQAVVVRWMNMWGWPTGMLALFPASSAGEFDAYVVVKKPGESSLIHTQMRVGDEFMGSINSPEDLYAYGERLGEVFDDFPALEHLMPLRVGYTLPSRMGYPE